MKCIVYRILCLVSPCLTSPPFTSALQTYITSFQYADHKPLVTLSVDCAGHEMLVPQCLSACLDIAMATLASTEPMITLAQTLQHVTPLDHTYIPLDLLIALFETEV